MDLRLNVEASASGRFQADEARAKEDRQGLWKGCFVAPQEFRRGKKDGALLGGACRSDRDREIREALFPDDLVMPASCNIKGKYAVRARVTGNLGIYHLQACRSYPGLAIRTAGFAPRTTPRQPGSAGPIIAAQHQRANEAGKAAASCVKLPAKVAGAHDPLRYFERPA